MEMMNPCSSILVVVEHTVHSSVFLSPPHYPSPPVCPPDCPPACLSVSLSHVSFFCLWCCLSVLLLWCSLFLSFILLCFSPLISFLAPVSFFITVFKLFFFVCLSCQFFYRGFNIMIYVFALFCFFLYIFSFTFFFFPIPSFLYLLSVSSSSSCLLVFFAFFEYISIIICLDFVVLIHFHIPLFFFLFSSCYENFFGILNPHCSVKRLRGEKW